MLLDPKNIEEETLMNFKGGEGELITRNYIDDKSKIMFSCLRPGASSGLHRHEGNAEIVYIISGTAVFNYDGVEETVSAGQVHDCPDGHSHFMMNRSEEDVHYLAVVK